MSARRSNRHPNEIILKVDATDYDEEYQTIPNSWDKADFASSYGTV